MSENGHLTDIDADALQAITDIASSARMIKRAVKFGTCADAQLAQARLEDATRRLELCTAELEAEHKS